MQELYCIEPIEEVCFDMKEKTVVSLVRCGAYADEQVLEALRASMHSLGGMEAYVKPGQKVLIKPNLLMRRSPERATTTHPSVIRAVVSLVQEVGGMAIIAESPGGPFSPSVLRWVYEGTGMKKVAQETGAVLNEDTRTAVLHAPEGKEIQRIDVMQVVLDADVLISVGKLKTHGLSRMTGAVKNLYGLVPGTVKVDYHARFPDREQFCNMLVDVCEAAKPALAVIDAVECMEGEGPSGGSARFVGALITSPNPHAADAVGASLIGLSTDSVPTLRWAEERGLLPVYRVDGETVEFLRVADFHVPMGKAPGQSGIEKLAQRIRFLRSKPVFPHIRCNGCGICVRSCPAKTIHMNDQNRPEVDLKHCIRCYCCQELCPQNDVIIKRHPLMRLLR